MRRALVRQWPAISRIYGLKPWELDLLTFDEIDAYLYDLKELADGAR